MRFKLKNSDRTYRLGHDNPVYKDGGEVSDPSGSVLGFDGNVVTTNDPLYKTQDGDVVRTILQPGEIIIPLRYVPLVTKFLRSKGIKFGNFK